jgi:MipA family protein
LLGTQVASIKFDSPAARPRDIPAIGVRPELGGFLITSLAPGFRISNQLYYGAGRHSNGLRHVLDVQHFTASLGARHRFSTTVGLTLANGDYQQSYFGLDAQAAQASGIRQYRIGAGLKDVHAQLRWNWILSPEWLVSSTLRVSRLQGDAARSPLVQRPAQVGLGAALAYRL